MLPLELWSAGAGYTLNVLRRQCPWRLPSAILPRPSYDAFVSVPVSVSTSFSLRCYATSFPIAKNLPQRERNSPGARRMVPLLAADRRFSPDNLHGILETHLDTSFASLIRTYSTTRKVNGPESDPLRPADRAKDWVRRRRSLGYQQRPKGEWEGPLRPGFMEDRRPWLAHLKVSPQRDEEVHRYLTAEILAFERYMDLTSSEEAAAGKALSDLRKVLTKTDPGIEMSVIGSRSTGLAMPLSDIDVNIEHPTRDWGASLQHTQKQTIDLLSTVRRNLKSRGGPKPGFNAPPVIKAKVPIVCAQHDGTRLEIQLQCSNDCYASRGRVKAYMSEFPTLRPLFLVLKQVLKLRGLATSREAGIGSYSLIMMIVATLKFSGTRFHPDDVARQLLYFLDFYTKIKFKTTAIAVDPPELFPKRYGPKDRRSPSTHPEAVHSSDQIATGPSDDSPNNARISRRLINVINKERPYLMCLQDPANPANDLGVHTTAIKHIQATFARLKVQTKTAMDMYEMRDRGTPFSMLEACLAGSYKLFEKRRRLLQRFGERLPEAPVNAEYL